MDEFTPCYPVCPIKFVFIRKIGGELSPAVDIVYVYMWCSSVGNVFLVSAHSSGPIT